jgi:hypothetical protein
MGRWEVRSKNLKRVHINKHILQRNIKRGEEAPAIGVEVSGEPKRYGHRVLIAGPSTVVHNQQHPLKCGARCWVETRASVVIEEDE